MPDRLEEIRARAGSATPGPWFPWDRGVGWHIAITKNREQPWGMPKLLPEGNDTDIGRREDAEFIAHARADVPWLCDEVERLASELAQWKCGRRRHVWPVVDSVPDGLHFAAELARAQGTEGGEDHDRLLREAAMRMKALRDTASMLLADRNRLRTLLAEHGIEAPK